MCCAVIATRLCLWLKYENLDFLSERDGQWTPVLLSSGNWSLIGWCAGDLIIPSGCAGGSLNRGMVCTLTWATLLMRALPMPFPERQREALTDMFWLIIYFFGNKKPTTTTYSCTSELRHHIEILHENSSALPWAVGVEVKCIAYLRMAWEKKNVT